MYTKVSQIIVFLSNLATFMAYSKPNTYFFIEFGLLYDLNSAKL